MSSPSPRHRTLRRQLPVALFAVVDRAQQVGQSPILSLRVRVHLTDPRMRDVGRELQRRNRRVGIRKFAGRFQVKLSSHAILAPTARLYPAGAG